MFDHRDEPSAGLAADGDDGVEFVDQGVVAL